MNEREKTIQRLMALNYPFYISATLDGYSACLPSLGILVSAKTLDDCYLAVQARKRSYFDAAIEQGFGDSLLILHSQISNAKRRGALFIKSLLVLSLFLLIVLIPTCFLFNQFNRLLPKYVESAMDIVQRRVHQWSEEDQRKLSGIARGICPVIDELVEAQCKRVQ